MAETAKGFWGSIPGILTGIAAMITALTGLYLALNSNGNNEPNGLKEPASIQTEMLEPTIPTAPDQSGTVSSLSTEEIIRIEALKKEEYEKLPDSGLSTLVDCKLFPTVNSTASLMSWSNHYHKTITANPENKQQIADSCDKAIDYRAMAHCKEPNNLAVRQALHETLTVCSAAGISWRDINHSSISQ